MSALALLPQDLGRQAAAFGDQRVILGIGLRSVSLESRIRQFPMPLSEHVARANSERRGRQAELPIDDGGRLPSPMA
jgi:hypothetical protein